MRRVMLMRGTVKSLRKRYIHLYTSKRPELIWQTIRALLISVQYIIHFFNSDPCEPCQILALSP
jgi:hypothetical protein